MTSPDERAGAHLPDLAGVTLLDARTGTVVDLAAGPPLAVLTVIRHRF